VPLASAELRDLHEIDIPAQSADLALIEFAEQTDQTLIFSFVDTKDVKSNFCQWPPVCPRCAYAHAHNHGTLFFDH